MRTVISILVALLCSGFVQPSGAAEFRGTMIFYNFYNERVRTYLNDEPLFDKTLDVRPEDESTGLSERVEVTLVGCTELLVVTTSGRFEETVCPEVDGFVIWIHPVRGRDFPPNIKFEQQPTTGLD